MGTGCSDCVRRDNETGEPIRQAAAVTGTPCSGCRNLLANNSGQHPKEGYHIEREPVGVGGFGVVRRVRSKKTSIECALKMVNKEKADVALLRNEVDINLTLDHPNIVKLFDVYEDKHFVYMVLEVCKGGEVLDKIVERKRFGQADALGLFGQLLYAVNYMHGKCVAHRDLKLENMLFKDEEADVAENTLKLIDFGFAKRFVPGKAEMTTLAGSAYYVAPEVLREDKPYGEKCDMWSAGVVLYMLLTGNPPFNGRSEHDIMDNIRTGNLDFPEGDWAEISDEAQQLVKRMLTRDVAERASCTQLLAEWRLAQGAQSKEPPSPAEGKRSKAFFTRLESFSATSRFEQAARHLIARRLDDSSIEGLRATFRSLDKDGDGTISLQEVQESLAEKGLQDNDDLMALFQKIDTDRSDKIDYTEFLAATMEKRHYMKEGLVWEAFRVFDKDQDGRISKAELEETLTDRSNPVQLSANEIQAMLQEVDADGDGSVDFNEFLKMMDSQNSGVAGKIARKRPAPVPELL